MMKVWFPTIRTGSGTDVFTERLAAGLCKRGVEAVVSWFPHFFELAPQLLRASSMPKGIDLIHANSWHARGFARAGIPLVLTIHHVVFEPEYRKRKSWLRGLYHEQLPRRHERAAFERAARITAVSQYAAECSERFNDAPAVQCISNWVDTDFFKPGTETRPSDRFRLLFVGNPEPHKGFHLLPAMMQALGEGFELRHTSRQPAGSLDACDSVIRDLGRLKPHEVLAELQQCDALILPSQGEAAPYSVIEAMACAKPVIASRNSALPEYVEDGVTGLLCAPESIESFVAAIRDLANNAEKALRMGQAGRQRAVERFSEQAAMDAYLRLYEEVLGQRSHSARTGSAQ